MKKLSIDLAKKLHARKEHTNFFLSFGKVEPIAFLVSMCKKTTRKWHKGSAVYAIFPPIEGRTDSSMAVDWYFIRIAFTPKTIDTLKPEATIFFSNSNGIVEDNKMEINEIRHTRTTLQHYPKTQEEFLKVQLQLLKKIYPKIKKVKK